MVQKTESIVRHCEECPENSGHDEAISLIARRLLRSLRSLAMTAVAFMFLVAMVFAEASVNVPIHHWAYDALEALNRAGLTGGSGLSTKPITRMEAARLSQIAIEKIQQEKQQFSPFDEAGINRAENALNSLVEEFRPELVALGVTTVARDDQPAKNLRFGLGDPIYTQTIYADLKDAQSITYENQRGFYLTDGLNARTRINSWLEVNNFLAFQLEPALKFSDDYGNLDVETAYAKLSFLNIELEAGRDTLWWGPGYHGSMLLSDNAYPLQLVKISNAHPFTLPWEKLGKWNIDFFAARLDKKRDFPHAKLGGMRIECAPFSRLTLGLSRTAVFGGKGRPNMDSGDYWDIFTGVGKRELSQDVNENVSDQKASVDFKLNILNMQFYGEWAGEDKFAPWENEAPGYLAGLLVSDIFKIYALDFRAEYAHNNASWYTHGIYSSGYRYKGSILGHHMGTDASDLFIRLSKRFDEDKTYLEGFILGGQLDYETHGISLAYPERKYEAAIDGEFCLSESKSVKVAYEHESYSNFTNVSGKQTRNNIFQAEANIKF